MASNNDFDELDDLDDLDADEREELEESEDESPEKDENSKRKALLAAAAAALALTMKQEKKIKEKLSAHFDALSKEVRKYYATHSKLPPLDDHRNTIKEIIQSHYISTAGFASRMFRDEFEDVTDTDGELINSIVDDKIDRDADEHSDSASDLISDTTESNFKDYIKDAIAIAATAGVLMSARDIGEAISEKFDETAEGRIDNISLTETGIAVSDGKLDEIQALEDVKADFEDGTNITEYARTKTWVAILDDRTRPWHEEADGQTVGVDEPFVVNGEELMMPRDDSLGASPDNLINCRCEGVISMELLN